MNYDKIAIKTVLNTGSLELLLKIQPNYLKHGMAIAILKTIKNYAKKYGKVPSLEVLSAEITNRLSTEKSGIYTSYLEGLMSVEADIDQGALLDALKSQYILKAVDEHVETLVHASAEKDVDTVKDIIATLNSSLNVSEKTPEDIRDIDYTPTNVRLIDSFLPSMRERKIKLGGLSIIGAGTGAGKSVLTLDQLMYSFEVDKLSVCLLNLELGSDESIARMYANATSTPFEEVHGNANPKMIAKVQAWKNKYFTSKDGNVFNMKNVRYNNNEIVEVIRQQYALGVTVFGIDYLQLVDSEKNAKEWETLRDLIRDLHTLTLELGIVIISPVQVNIEDVEEGDNGVKLKVRGSRELENSSTCFFFIYQSVEEYKEDIARIFSIKLRNGRKYTYVCKTDFKHMKFLDTGLVL